VRPNGQAAVMSFHPPLAPPNRDRAVEALDRCVVAAETGRASIKMALVGAEDFADLPPSDLRQRLDRVLLGEFPEAGLESLLTTGVLDSVLPEIKALVGFGDGEWRHKDVWKHTKQVVAQATPRIEVRWAALFHDIGKVKTRSISPEGEVHFFGHAEVGARMFDRVERRMRFFAAEATLCQSVRFLVLHHLRANQYDRSWSDSAVRRFAREIGTELDNLLCLSRADITTKRAEKRRRGVALIDELSTRITALEAEDAVVPPLPSGVGNDLMQAFKLPPSRLIGEIKRALEAAVDAGEIDGQREASYYVSYVSEHQERFGLR
jgi:poly(A) polymerase